MIQCLRIVKKAAFVLKPLKAMINYVVDRLSIQKPEYEMDHTDLPDDYNFLE